jgi:putative inorganic carbon (HCO3(-)) transporter
VQNREATVWVRRLAALELVAVALVAPVLLFPSSSRLPVLVALVPVFAAVKAATGRFLPRTPFNAAVIALLAMVGVSLWATPIMSLSLSKVAGVVLGVLFFWAAIRWVTTRAHLDFALAAFAAGGALLALVGLIGTDFGAKVPVVREVVNLLPRVIRGVPGAETGANPNALAGALVLFVPLQLALVANSRRDSGALFFAALAGAAVTLLTIVLTQSRGAWLGLVIAGFFTSLWSGRRARLLAPLVVALAIGAVWATNAVDDDSTAVSRVEIWSRAIAALRDVPMTGMGMGTFRAILPIRYPVFSGPADMPVAHAHNHLLQAGLDLGIPGLIAYLAIWTIAFTLLAEAFRRSHDSRLRNAASGLAAGLIAHFAFGMGDAIPLGAKVGLVFWAALALVAGLHREVRSEKWEVRSEK